MLMNRGRRNTTSSSTAASRENGPATHCVPGARKRASERASARVTRKATTTYQPSTAARLLALRYHRPNRAVETKATARVAIGTARSDVTARSLALAPLPNASLVSGEEKGKRKARPKSSDNYRSRAKRQAFFFHAAHHQHHQPPLPPRPPPRRPASEISGRTRARPHGKEQRRAAGRQHGVSCS